MEPDSDHQLAATLSALSGELPDPLRIKAELGRFLERPGARALLPRDAEGAQALLRFIRTRTEPWLKRVAAILLFQSDPDLFYADFLRDAADYDRATVEALEQGLWLGPVDEEQIARDLAKVAARSGNAPLLLLLQRPASRAAKEDLRALIARREMPISLFALHAYGYALRPEDREFLAEVAAWEDAGEAAAVAGLLLRKLGPP